MTDAAGIVRPGGPGDGASGAAADVPGEPAPESRLTCEARMGALPELLEAAVRAARRAGADDSAAFDVRLAVEEVVTNVVMHGYAGVEPPGPIELVLAPRPGTLVVRIEDRARTYSPEEAAVPDVAAEAEDRAVGGLGWHLVRQVVDELRHEPRAGGGNVLTLVKRMGGGARG